MEQATLDGSPQPKTRARIGRPRKAEADKAGSGPLVRFYKEDKEALRVVREAGYEGSDAEVMRSVLRERAAALTASQPDYEARLTA